MEDARLLDELEALARLRLAARRAGREFPPVQVGPRLRELVELAGLAEVLLGVEPGRQAEQREQGPGVEEGVEPDDPPG